MKPSAESTGANADAPTLRRSVVSSDPKPHDAECQAEYGRECRCGHLRTEHDGLGCAGNDECLCPFAGEDDPCPCADGEHLRCPRCPSVDRTVAAPVRSAVIGDQEALAAVILTTIRRMIPEAFRVDETAEDRAIAGAVAAAVLDWVAQRDEAAALRRLGESVDQQIIVGRERYAAGVAACIATLTAEARKWDARDNVIAASFDDAADLLRLSHPVGDRKEGS